MANPVEENSSHEAARAFRKRRTLARARERGARRLRRRFFAADRCRHEVRRAVDEKGEERPLTQSSYSSFLVKRDHDLRKRAFHQFYAEFEDHQFTLADSLSYSVKADVFRARARNYPSALEASLFKDDVPSAVYDALITSVRQNLAPLFRYYELRRRVLGLDELHAYDTYVPLVAEIETDISFDQAIERCARFACSRSARNMSMRSARVCAGAGAIATKRKGNGAALFLPAVTARRLTS